MAFLHSLVSAAPPYSVTAEEALDHLRPFFSEGGRDAERVESLFANARVDRRSLARPQAFYLEHRSLTARNAAYVVEAQRLGVEVARRALEAAGVASQQVDFVIDTSCTGIMIPALDAYVANALEMRRHVRRLPLTEVGCAAGAVALARARELLRGEPDATALVLAVELPSLTLQLDDASRANLVSAAIFGDGAAAAVLRSDRPAAPTLELLASRSVLFPNTLDVMGFDLRTEGFKIVLSARIPALVKQALRPEVDAFLADEGRTLADLEFFVLHPGGTRVLDNLRDVLELTERDVALSREVLRTRGNLSSASVLVVAEELLRAGAYRPGSLGLIAAMGPGFAAELLLVRGHA